jgi:tetratricopeptide (TPR) repeat protein/predicted Ser/Thr protein kinase
MAMMTGSDDERTVLLASGVVEGGDAGDGASAGSLIGAYRLERLIGEGGMGQVWLAEQREPIQRKVALKLIRRQLAGSLAEAYFEIERQALARMDHPAIAKVLDAGRTSEGFPWFAMEYVDGQPLDEWCSHHAPTQRARIELIIALAFGVQHAHQRGIIHRDLKPSNVLVSLIDGRPQPRLIDFGIATAVDNRQSSNARSSYERVGSGLYMSPEQYAADSSLDTRSDVYSLGMVLLVTLLAGEESDILKGLDPHTRQPHARIDASLRAPGREPALERLPRELRHILARATHPDREARYDSATAFADDLQRYLDGDAVLAVPPSRMYRLRKFVQRRRRLLAATGLVALALVVGLVVAVWGFVEAERQARKSKATSEFFATVLSGIDPELAADLDKTLMRKVLDEAARRAAAGLGDQADALAEIENVIAGSYMALGEYVTALEHSRRAYDLSTVLHGENDPRTLNMTRQLGRLMVDTGDVADGVRFLREAVARAREVGGGNDRTTLMTMQALGWALREDQEREEALAVLRQAGQGLMALLGPDNDDTINARFMEAILLADLDRHEQAIPLLTEQIDRLSALNSPDHAGVLNMRNSLAVFHLQKRRFAEAEVILKDLVPAMERVFGPDNTNTVMAAANLGGALRQQGKVEESGPHYLRALESNLARFGPLHTRTVMAQHNYANYLLDAGRAAEAFELQDTALQAAGGSLGEKHPVYAGAMRGKGMAAMHLGRLQQAEELLLQALALQESMWAPGNSQIIQTREALVKLYEKMGRPEAAARYRD